jgi:conflict system STAND superfamily ATPase/restriction endonuclease
MPDYDFSTLSPIDFEYLTRDLLQKKLDIFLESFTSGRDGGIDLRHSSDKEKTLIVQCKHYSNSTLSNLKSSLKKELDKLKKLNPSRYIVCTSMALTPANKDEIKKILHPYIKKTEDIIHKTDLNNLLGLYPDIEKQHIKLWMTSSAVLDRILKSKVHNYSDFECDEIEDNIKKFVKAEAFQTALEIIQDNNILVISGIPGIGKTTLARMLVYHFLLSEDQEAEFIYITQNIADAYENYNPDKRQIFLYDDFLGSNFLEDRLAKNEDKDIVNFIQKIKKSTGKILIFTTREYILNQAKHKYERLQAERSIELAKCTLDISSYNNMAKAQILYNHLYYSNLPSEYILSLLSKGRYLNIINHSNYSPRIIERITSPDIFSSIHSPLFYYVFMNYLDNPEAIWKHAYESQIGCLSQTILLILATCRTPILLTDLEKAVEKYENNQGCSFSDMNFNNSLKELENTFITITAVKKNIYLDFQNPSIFDFVINYLKTQSRTIEKIINSACFFDQYFEAFQWSEQNNYKRKILLNKSLKPVISENIIKNWNSLKSYRNRYAANWQSRSEISEISKLYCLYGVSEFDEFAVMKLNFICNNTSIADNHEELLNMIEYYSEEIEFDDVDDFICDFLENCPTKLLVEAYNTFESIDKFKENFHSGLETGNLIDIVDSNISSCVDELDNWEAEEHIDTLTEVKEKYKIDINCHLEKLNNMHDEYSSEDWEESSFSDSSSILDKKKETENYIKNMFETLKQ